MLEVKSVLWGDVLEVNVEWIRDIMEVSYITGTNQTVVTF